MTLRIPTPPIIVCSEWQAHPPRTAPIVVGRPNKILFHHTDGHAAILNKDQGINRRNAIRYAKQLQNDMMVNRGWNDTGQNFTVMRSGIILQGRWGTVSAIEHGRMVMSAHCPGQNDQPGIEHEHVPGELLTKAQLNATIWLMAWICDRTGIRSTELYGHSHFYNTACPSNLLHDIPSLRLDVAHYLNQYGRQRAVSSAAFTVKRAVRKELRG